MLARPQPVLGWLNCEPGDSKRLLDRWLAHRNQALEADPSFSGMPPRFVDEIWVKWLPKAVAKPLYRDQLTAHVAELEHQISSLSREIELQSGRLHNQRNVAIDLRKLLNIAPRITYSLRAEDCSRKLQALYQGNMFPENP